KPWVGDQLCGEVEWKEQTPFLKAGQEISLHLKFNSPVAKIFSLSLQGAEPPRIDASLVAAKLQSPPKKDPRELWRFAATGKISSSPALHEGLVFFGSWDQQLYALDAQTGK